MVLLSIGLWEIGTNMKTLITTFIVVLSSMLFGNQELDEFCIKFDRYLLAQSKKLTAVYDKTISSKKSSPKLKAIMEAKKSHFSKTIENSISVKSLPDDFVIEISDPVLKKRIYEQLDKIEDETLRLVDVKDIDALNFRFDQSKETRKITDISPLKYFLSLKNLNLGWQQVENVQPLAELKNLVRLELTSNKIVDVSPLSELTNLQFLDLNFNQVSDITSLKSLKALEELRLGENKINDCSPISKMKKLTCLRLSRNKLSSEAIAPIAELAQLNRLDITGNKIDDVEVINKLPNLTFLSLESNPVKNLDILNNLDNLIYINLGGTPETDLSFLKHAKNLSTAWIYSTKLINYENLGDYCPKLSSCRFTSCQLTDITFLSKVKNLHMLQLSNNQLISIEPLKSLKKMNTLHLNNTKIKDISPILGMTKNGCFKGRPFWAYAINLEDNNLVLTKGSKNREVLDELLKTTDKISWQKGNTF